MNYQLLTQDILLERYDSLPDEVKDVLNSEEDGKIIRSIGKTQYLNEEKLEVFEQLVGLVLLGFIHTRELAHFISEELFLNFDHSRALVDELDKKIFVSIQKQLEQAYTPLKKEVPKQPEKKSSGLTVSLDFFPGKARKESAIPVKKVPMVETLKPFILHEEKNTVETTPKEERKRFSLPFKFFKSLVAPSQEEKAPTRGEIGIPKTHRVVHYDEARTPVSPSLVPPLKQPYPNAKPIPRSLSGFPRAPSTQPVDPSLIKVPEVNPKVNLEEKPQPRIQGNVIDLR